MIVHFRLCCLSFFAARFSLPSDFSLSAWISTNSIFPTYLLQLCLPLQISTNVQLLLKYIFLPPFCCLDFYNYFYLCIFPHLCLPSLYKNITKTFSLSKYEFLPLVCPDVYKFVYCGIVFSHIAIMFWFKFLKRKNLTFNC